MSRNDELTVNSTQIFEYIEIPEKIIDDLMCIKDILRDNPGFFIKLIKECMKVRKVWKGQDIFYRNVENLLVEEYPDLTTNTDGDLLIRTTYDLLTELWRYKNGLRDQLEHTIEEEFLRE